MSSQTLTPLQATSLQTNSAGQVVWTFPTPAAPGKTHAVFVDVASSDAVLYEHKVLSLSATEIIVQVLKPEGVSIGIHSLLGGLKPAGAGITVNLLAVKKST